jgi:hypothetical protein
MSGNRLKAIDTSQARNVPKYGAGQQTNKLYIGVTSLSNEVGQPPNGATARTTRFLDTSQGEM